MALWGSPRLHTRPGLPPAHLGSGLQAPSASGRPQAQRLVSVTASERSYTPLAHDGCREWEGGASPSMSLHSREKKTQRKKKRTKKIPRETSVERKHQKPAFQRSRVGRGTLQPRKHGRATGQEPPFLSPPSSPPATSGLLLLWQ